VRWVRSSATVGLKVGLRSSAAHSNKRSLHGLELARKMCSRSMALAVFHTAQAGAMPAWVMVLHVATRGRGDGAAGAAGAAMRQASIWRRLAGLAAM
jgi:hypothetical protein